jgi:tRNA(adenine34) deaminase
MPDQPTHEAYMRLALAEARRAQEGGEVPVGAVLVADGRVVGRGSNRPIGSVDPTAHAEIVALREAASALANYRLVGVTAYVTLEPCLMCVGALLNARVATVVYGAREPKWGAVCSLVRLGELAMTHRFEVVEGVLEEDCRLLMVEFFRARRSSVAE